MSGDEGGQRIGADHPSRARSRAVLRGARTLNRQRLALGLLLFALIPAAVEVPALATLGVVTALLCAMIAYETRRYGERRGRVRHQYAVEGATSPYSPS